MPSILIDCAVFNIKNKNSFCKGLIIEVDNRKLNELEKLPLGQKRLEFVETILSNDTMNKTEIYYDKGKDIVLLNSECLPFIKSVLDCLRKYCTDKTLIWVFLPQENCRRDCKILSANGFRDPYVTDISPNGDNIGNSICMTRENSNIPKEQTDNKIDYTNDINTKNITHIVNQAKHLLKLKDDCHINIRFSQGSLKLLYSLTKKLKKTKKEIQKEQSGEFLPANIVKEGDKYIYIIEVNEKSIESGENENVNVSPTRYNFHSHPEDAYIHHSVTIAWPSSTDYLGYLHLGKNTIFHCVVTLEGLYILSFSSYWGNRIDKIDKSFVGKHYDINHKAKYTPEEYVNKINNIRYKNYPIFDVQFITWEEAKTKIITVYFSPHGKSCLDSQRTKEKYKKLHR